LVSTSENLRTIVLPDGLTGQLSVRFGDLNLSFGS